MKWLQIATFKNSQNSNRNSLDDNIVTDQIANYSMGESLNNSLNGSSDVTESNSTNNDQQVLCNNNLNNLKNNNSNLIKSSLNGKPTKQSGQYNANIQSHSVFKPPAANKTASSLSCSCGSNYLEHSEITCKNSRNSILITNNNSVNPQFLSNMHLVNNLNIMNLETTEL